ncbi:MAG: hypothetical protein NC221_00325 [Duncaniella sp.]|nr:hypothetical protein [Muribaculum sp.]MCM1254552.1 hypothetical protein [Duncaniella sp.]
MKILSVVIISVLLVALAAVLLGVKVLFVKGGRFPSGHVHDNPKLREKGFGCAGHLKN